MENVVDLINNQIPVKVKMEYLKNRIKEVDDESRKKQMEIEYNLMDAYTKTLEKKLNALVEEYGPDKLYDLIDALNISLGSIEINKERLEYRLEELKNHEEKLIGDSDYNVLISTCASRLKDLEAGIRILSSSIKVMENTRELKRKNTKQLILRKEEKKYTE